MLKGNSISPFLTTRRNQKRYTLGQPSSNSIVQVLSFRGCPMHNKYDRWSIRMHYFWGLKNKAKPPELDWIPASTQWAMPLRAKLTRFVRNHRKMTCLKSIKTYLMLLLLIRFISSGGSFCQYSFFRQFLSGGAPKALHNAYQTQQRPGPCREAPRRPGGRRARGRPWPGAAPRAVLPDLRPRAGRAGQRPHSRPPQRGDPPAGSLFPRGRGGSLSVPAPGRGPRAEAAPRAPAASPAGPPAGSAAPATPGRASPRPGHRRTPAASARRRERRSGRAGGEGGTGHGGHSPEVRGHRQREATAAGSARRRAHGREGEEEGGRPGGGAHGRCVRERARGGRSRGGERRRQRRLRSAQGRRAATGAAEPGDTAAAADSGHPSSSSTPPARPSPFSFSPSPLSAGTDCCRRHDPGAFPRRPSRQWPRGEPVPPLPGRDWGTPRSARGSAETAWPRPRLGSPAAAGSARMSGGGGSREEERRKLADIINHWNANRLDLFEISDPTEVSDPGGGLPPALPARWDAAPGPGRAPRQPGPRAAPRRGRGSGTGFPALTAAGAPILAGERGTGPSPCPGGGRLQRPGREKERRAGALPSSLSPLPQAHAGPTLRDRRLQGGGETRWAMEVAKGGGQGREYRSCPRPESHTG